MTASCSGAARSRPGRPSPEATTAPIRTDERASTRVQLRRRGRPRRRIPCCGRVLACRSTSSTAPTSCSATSTHRGGGHPNGAGEEVGAVRGVLRATAALLEEGATHLGVATDHVIESFRNDLWPGYKTGEGIDPTAVGAVPAARGGARGARRDGLGDGRGRGRRRAGAAAARRGRRRRGSSGWSSATPDKDLAQCVGGTGWCSATAAPGSSATRPRCARSTASTRRRSPTGSPSSATPPTGSPVSPGWGAKTAAAVLRRYGHLEEIPDAPGQWDVPGLRGAAKLAATLAEHCDDAALFKRLATLDTDGRRRHGRRLALGGPTADFEDVCDRVDALDVLGKVHRIATRAEPEPNGGRPPSVSTWRPDPGSSSTSTAPPSASRIPTRCSSPPTATPSST